MKENSSSKKIHPKNWDIFIKRFKDFPGQFKLKLFNFKKKSSTYLSI